MWRVLGGLGLAGKEKEPEPTPSAAAAAVDRDDPDDSTYATDDEAVREEEELIAAALLRAEEEHEAEVKAAELLVKPQGNPLETEFQIDENDIVGESPSFLVIRGRWRRALTRRTPCGLRYGCFEGFGGLALPASLKQATKLPSRLRFPGVPSLTRYRSPGIAGCAPTPPSPSSASGGPPLPTPWGPRLSPTRRSLSRSCPIRIS